MAENPPDPINRTEMFKQANAELLAQWPIDVTRNPEDIPLENDPRSRSPDIRGCSILISMNIGKRLRDSNSMLQRSR